MRKKTDYWCISAALFCSALCLAGIGSTSDVSAAANESAMWLSHDSLGAESKMHSSSESVPPKVLPSIAATSDDEEWQPIRIRYFIDDLWNSSKYCSSVEEMRVTPISALAVSVRCREGDILTTGKNNTLLNYLLPQAVQMHQKRLKVRQVPDNMPIVVGSTNMSVTSYCNSFTIPTSHTKSGVTDADFAFYVAAGPIINTYVEAVDGFHCNNVSEVNRVMFGYLAFNLQYVPDTGNMSGDEITALAEDTGNDLDRVMRMTARAILHGLGFTIDIFSHIGMSSTVKLREKSNVLVLNSPNVMAAARVHYGIGDDDTFVGMEMEEITSTRYTSRYWKGRSARDDLMAPQLTFGRYSAITMAAMEDTGYFKPVYELAEQMVWGSGAGVTLFTEKCIVDGASKFPSMFCASDDQPNSYCTSSHLNFGTCEITTHTDNLPDAMQYFAGETKRGGSEAYMDYCPIVNEISNTSCVSGDIDLMPGSILHESSRCFSASNMVVSSTSSQTKTICAKRVCDKAKKTYEILVSGAKAWITCNQTVNISDTGSAIFQPGGIITCPSYDIICNEDTETYAPSVPDTAPPASQDSAQGHIRSLLLMWSAVITVLCVL